MQRLLALVEKHLGGEWTGAIDWVRNLPVNSISEIERRLYAGDIAGVVAEVQSAALKFAAETHQAYVTSGQRGAKWLDDHPSVADKLIRFDQTHHRAVERAKRNQLELVQGMTSESREVIRTVLTDGQRAGLNPREMARDIRTSIGLTQNQHEYVANYRRALEQADYTRAMGYELRDARSDQMLTRMRRDGGSLSPDQVDRMVEQYRKAQIAWRGENIARTESAKQVHEGLDAAYTQAIERGDIEADSLVKEWIPGPDTEHARPMHRAAALLEQRPAVGKPFVLADGTRMLYPNAAGAPVGHVAQCRCTYATTMIDAPAASAKPR